MAVFITILFASSFMLAFQLNGVLAAHYQDASKIGIHHMENEPESVDELGLVVQLETQLEEISKKLSSGRARNVKSIKNLKDRFTEFVKGIKTERDEYSKTINKLWIQLAECAKSLKTDHNKNVKSVNELRDQLMEDYNFIKELKVNLDKDSKTVMDMKSQLIHDAENVKELKSQLIHDAESVKELKSQLIHERHHVKELKKQLTVDVETVKELKSQLIDDTNFVNELKTSYVTNANIASNLTYQLLRDVDQVKHLKAQSERDPKVNRKLKFKFLQANKTLKKLESPKTKDTRLKVQYEEGKAKKPRFKVNEDIEFIQDLEKQKIRQDSEFTNNAGEKDSKTERKVMHCDCSEAVRNAKASESKFLKVTDKVNQLYVQQTKNTQIISEMAKQISQFQKENRKNIVMLDSHDVWLKRIFNENHQDVQRLGTKVFARNISESNFELQNADTKKRNTDTVAETVVAFYASMVDHTMTNPSPGQAIQFDQVITNEGDSYNKHTGVFTCKIGGIYVFAWTIDAITERLFKTYLVKNSAAIGFEENGYSNHPDTGSNTIIVQLDVGDRVWIKVLDGGAGSIDSYESSFSGFLLK